MIDRALLEYDYDEERLGFAEPRTPAEDAALPWSQKVAHGILGVGLLALLVQSFGGPGQGTWIGFGSSFGLIALGVTLGFVLSWSARSTGLHLEGTYFTSARARGALGWLAGVLMTGFYVLIYWHPEYLGHREGADPTGLVAVVDPLARVLTGLPASQWFLYGVLYTLAILIFGVRMLLKYRGNRYHRLRTLSVMFFQLGFAWLLPNLLVLFRAPYLEFNGIWPLKHDYLWPDKVSEFTGAAVVGALLFTWVLALVVATPILTYFLGKRWYCSWVCGCGGLAETLGDPWRHLSDKSTRAWRLERWMIHGVLAAVLLATAMLWIDGLTGQSVFRGWSQTVKSWYGFYVGALFAGVAGVGFYPLLGSRVWCRFGCPQAAILGLWQRCFSRFRITTNGGQCMSCGNCSTYCEQGIDVQSYAQRGENIVRASCVGCGVCSAVCPRGVLRLENGSTHADRFAGAEDPVGVLLAGLHAGPEVPGEPYGLSGAEVCSRAPTKEQ